jgi:hypothetical protein
MGYMQTLDDIRRARKQAVPLVAVETPDVWALLSAIAGLDCPVIAWDAVRGLYAGNAQGKTEIADLGDPREVVEQTANIIGALDTSLKLKSGSVIVYVNAGRFLDDPVVGSALSNCREPFKGSKRMLVLTGGTLKLPVEVASDTLLLTEPLPQDNELGEKLGKVVAQANQALQEVKLPVIDLADAKRESAVTAGKGLSLFGAEQVYSVSVSEKGFDLDSVWARKAKQVSQTKGLYYSRPKSPTFADIRGMEALQSDLTDLFGGKLSPQNVVFVDEVEKTIGGAGGGDLTGISQDFLGQWLTEMQDRRALGIILQGWNGCGKSLIGYAVAAQFGVGFTKWDTSAMKGSLVGDSEAAIRLAFKVLWSLADDGRTLFLATCNRQAGLPPEFKARFRTGSYWVDIPDKRQGEALWTLYLGKYSIAGYDAATLAETYPGWTGREIDQVCERAWRGGKPIEFYASRVIPSCVSGAAKLREMRQEANGNLIDATTGKPFQMDSTVSGERTFEWKGSKS